MSDDRLAVEERLIEALLDGRAPEEEDRRRAASDPELAAFADGLARLGAALHATDPAPVPEPALVARTARRAALELRPAPRRAVAGELGRLVLALAPVVLLLLGAHVWLVRHGPALLADLLPPVLAVALPVLYAASAVGWLALLLAALPALAHRTAARRRPREVPA